MAIIKQAGQVGTKKVTAETLQDRLNRLSAGATTDGATAASMGATPQQAAMAGADNRKQAVLKQAVNTSTNLQVAQDKPVDPQAMSSSQQAEVASSQQAEVAAAQKLASLGGVSGRIGQQAAARLSGAPLVPVERQVTATKVSDIVKLKLPPGTDPTSTITAVTDLLVKYANAYSSGTPATSEEVRRDTLIELERLGIYGNELNGLIETTEQALQRTLTAAEPLDIGKALIDSGYMSNTPNATPESAVADLAQTLGVDSTLLATMGMDDIDDLIEARRKEIAGKYTAMQTKAAGVGLGAAAAKQNQSANSTASALIKTAGAVPAIDFTAKIQIGDSEYDAETMLKDEEFSGVIEQWLKATTPEARAKIIPADWPLSAWLTSNEKTLKDATALGMATIQDTTFAKDTAGYTLTNLPKEVATLFGFEAKKHYTSTEIAAMDAIAAKWAESPLAKAGADADYMKAYAATPGLTLEGMNALSEADIKASMLAFKGLSGKTKPNDPDDITTFKDKVGNLLNAPIPPALTADPMMLKQSTRDAVAAKIALYTADPDADNWLKVGDYVADYAKLDNDTILKLAKNKNVRTQYEEYLKDVKSFSSDVAEDQDRLAFGSAVEMSAADDTYQRLKKEAALGDPQAISDLEEYKLMDTSGDGKITSADSAANVNKIRTGLKVYDTNTIFNQGNDATYTPISEVNAKRLLRIGNVDNRLALDILSSTETPNRESIPTLNKYYTTNAKRLAELEGKSELTPQEISEKNNLTTMQAHITRYADSAYTPLTEAARGMEPEVTSLTDLEVAYKNANNVNRPAAKAALKQAMDLNRANYSTALSEIRALQVQYKNAPLASSYTTTLNAMEATLQAKLSGMPTDPDNIPDENFIPPISIDIPLADFSGISGIGDMGIGGNINIGSGGGKGDIGGGSSLSTPMMGPSISGLSGSAKQDTAGASFNLGI